MHHAHLVYLLFFRQDQVREPYDAFLLVVAFHG